MAREPLPALTTQQLEYLVEVVEAPTWADAASRLGVSPSALSQGLSQLERRLGMTLFDRDGRRRVLRPSAQPVLEYARTMVAETRDLARWAGSAARGEVGDLRVGMIDLAAVEYFGPTLREFRRQRPDVRLQLAVAPSAELCEQLLAGAIGLAVIVEPAVNTGRFTMTPLLDDELAIYGPDDRIDQPVGEWGPWVTFPATSHTRQLVATELRRLGAPFDVVAESHQPEVLRGMVSLGMGMTVLPVLQGETQPYPLPRARPEPLLSRHVVAAQRHGTVADPLAEALLADLLGAV